MPKVVVIGGGTGTFVSLYGLKKYPASLSAIITMTDSGGSSGKLRDQYGVLPPGDIRQALVALSDSADVWRQLFLYRFDSGDFKGHNFGNVFLTVLEKITNNFEQSIELAQEVLKTKGQVIPVTLASAHIQAKLADGSIIRTEGIIDQKVKRPAITRLMLAEDTPANPKALEALREADYILVGPGDLYTSILPIFTFKTVVQAYRESKAKKVLIMNLMNKLGQTDDFAASDFLRIYSEYLGDQPFEFVVANDAPLNPQVLSYYQRFGESQVFNDLKTSTKLKVLTGNLVSSVQYSPKQGDALERSVIRHDAEALAQFIWEKIIR